MKVFVSFGLSPTKYGRGWLVGRLPTAKFSLLDYLTSPNAFLVGKSSNLFSGNQKSSEVKMCSFEIFLWIPGEEEEKKCFAFFIPRSTCGQSLMLADQSVDQWYCGPDPNPSTSLRSYSVGGALRSRQERVQ